MFFKKRILLLFLFIISLFYINSQEIVIVFPKDGVITEYCTNNVYNFEFKVSFSQTFDKIIPFEIPLPNTLTFKCIIDGPNSKIACSHSFSNYVWSLSDNSKVELPHSFPYVEGIEWDYDSFLRKIYRHLWRNKGNCGLEYENSNINGQINEEVKPKTTIKNEIIGNVEEIYDGDCYSSKYDYSFLMKIKLKEGIFIDELKNAKENKKNIKINFLHNIYVPILLGEKNVMGTITFKKDYDYKYAFCQYKQDINEDIIDKQEGLIFQCHIPVSQLVQLKGPLQIKPFTDFVYITKTDKDGKNTTKRIGIEFNIPSSSKIESDNGDKKARVRLASNIQLKNEEPIIENESIPSDGKKVMNKVTETNLRNLDDKTKSQKKEPNFLILDSNLNIFMCPDKPILTIKNYDEGITFGGLSNTNVKYLFLISGYLTNGYDFTNNSITVLDMTKEDIQFYLELIDNLEPPDNRKKKAKCTIPAGTSINKNELVEIRCIGRRANLGINNTDFILNWNLEKNNDFHNIVIRWPYDLTKKKHIFYYDIHGLSVNKEDYGCFENKFYFYLYVYDLQAEPKISFNLPLVNPPDTKAVCKLYNSVTFKCVIDLRLKKLSKGENIILPYNMTKYLSNKELSIILYRANLNNSLSSQADFVLPIPEDCGDYILVGAIKDIGFSYLQVIIIIICIFGGIGLCILGVVFCVIYEITHRNRKGQYYRHTEEKLGHVTVTTQTQIKQSP